jgi:tetratricopeptide (TPR) repeat protein
MTPPNTLGERFEKLRSKFAGIADRRLFVALFVCAFLIRLVYLLQVKDTPFFNVLVGDAFSYDAWAQEIQNDFIGHQVFYQAPLYPYFLALIFALFGHNLFLVRAIQIALGSLSCVLLAHAGRAFFSRSAGVLAGLLLALYGPALFFDGLIQKASLDLFLTSGLLFCLGHLVSRSSTHWLALCGATLGCLALTRENALALFPLLILWLLWRLHGAGNLHWKAALRSIGPFVLGGLLILGPVALRNESVGGEFFLTTSQMGVNFFNGNNANADGEYTPLRFGRGSFAQEREDAIDLAQQASGRELSAGEVSHFWLTQAWSWISEHPGDWFTLLQHKWLLVWSDHEIPDSDQPIVYQDASVVLSVANTVVSFGTLLPLALVGFIAAWPDRRRVGILYLLLFGAAASVAVFYVCARYRLPMVPLLCLFATAGIFELAALWATRRTAQLAGSLALALLVLVLSRHWQPSDEHPRATAHYNLALSLEGLNESENAETAYRHALADYPEFVQAHVNLGSLLARGGNFEAAINEETAALRLKPDDANAHTIIANALLQLGQLGQAEEHYRAALAIDPDLTAAREGFSLVQQLKAPGHP